MIWVQTLPLRSTPNVNIQYPDSYQGEHNDQGEHLAVGDVVDTDDSSHDGILQRSQQPVPVGMKAIDMSRYFSLSRRSTRLEESCVKRILRASKREMQGQPECRLLIAVSSCPHHPSKLVGELGTNTLKRRQATPVDAQLITVSLAPMLTLER